MKPVPDYPRYNTAHPPSAARWLSAAALLVLFSGGTAALLQPVQGKNSLIAAGILLALLLAGTGWLVRLLYYRISVHNAAFYHQLVEYEQQQWWDKHRQPFGLKERVLLGPAGTCSTDWLRMLNREHRPPEEKKEGDGSALRLPQISVIDAAAREKRLAELLVIEWQKQRSEKSFTSPLRCYWLGSEAAWQVFVTQMAQSFPTAVFPIHPTYWKGEESMSAIADELNHATSEGTILCAGCCSTPTSQNNEIPAGEAAVLWLLGKTGKVQFSRGEVFDEGIDESIVAVAQRALVQSELEQPPDSSFLFSHHDIPDLDKTGWNVTQYVQDLNWGALAELEPMVVQTLAAIFVEHNGIPCGWLARDPNHTLALGIVKPYGSGN